MGDVRRKQILEGLLEAVAERGLQNCNMSDVASAAGVSRGILHYYFKNKDEMISALVEHLKESKFPEFSAQTREAEDPWEQLATSLWYPVQNIGAGGAALARVWIEFWGMAAHHPDVHEFILGLQRQLREHYREILERGVASGAFSDRIRPAQTASVILGALEGLILQWHFDPEGLSFIKELKTLEQMLQRTLAP